MGAFTKISGWGVISTPVLIIIKNFVIKTLLREHSVCGPLEFICSTSSCLKNVWTHLNIPREAFLKSCKSLCAEI